MRLRALLSTDGLQLQGYSSVESTNALCKAAAEHGAPEGTVILADHQHGGRGTRGRSFYSPCGTGLYMSILLRPTLPAEACLSVTTAAAVAVCRAIERVSPQTAQIKWVNDVYCGGNKVCGILTEAALAPQTGGVSYAVLGIGINVCDPDGGFPEELKGIAASVFGKERGDRALLAAAVLDAFFELYPRLGEGAHIAEYRRRSMLDGRTVTVSTPDGVREATVCGIDEQCRLQVRYANGEDARLCSGDVQLTRF